MAELLVFHRGQTILKEQLVDTLSIGSHPDCDLSLKDEVAPYHARLEITPQHIVLIEQAGPLYVNGEHMVGPVRLTDGDLFDIGAYRFQLLFAEPTPEEKTRTATLLETGETQDTAIPTLHLLKPVQKSFRQVRLILGRGAGCDLSFASPKVSSRHAEIYCSQGAYCIRDLQSKNGTYVNDRRITERELPFSGTVKLGPVVLTYKIAAATSDPENTVAALAVPGLQPNAPSRLLVGQAPAFQKVIRLLGKIAASNDSVLLVGETGTGKDLLAHYLHCKNPKRNSHPFVIVNAATIPPNMADSQLFGHVRGAFTGAVGNQTGFFQQAHRGTLFLDEIGDLSLDSQARLLRVLEDGMVRPLGADREVAVDVRVVFATNRDLKTTRLDGKFREDLYERFDWIVPVPALAERKEDIPLLAKYFLKQNAPLPMQLAPESLMLLQEQNWPGNIRALNRAIRRAITNAMDRQATLLTPGDFDQLAPALGAERLSTTERRELKRKTLPELVKRHQGNISDISRELGLSRLTIRRWLEADGLKEKA